MQIFTGTDIIEIYRIKESIENLGENFKTTEVTNMNNLFGNCMNLFCKRINLLGHQQVFC